jgi:hypothetical protein
VSRPFRVTSEVKQDSNLRGLTARYVGMATVGRPANNYHGEPSVIRKVLFSAAITLGASVALAAPAGADPSTFGNLSCSCEPTVSYPAARGTAVDQGILSGMAEIADLKGIPDRVRERSAR